MPPKTPNSIHTLVQPLPSTILTIFGATGDLSSDYLIPALLHLDAEKLLPKDFKLVCVGRREFTPEQYLDYIVEKSSVRIKLTVKAKKSFLKHLHYYRGDFSRPDSFGGLSQLLDDKEKPSHRCFNRLFYFATSPEFFPEIAHILQQSGLLRTCEHHNRKLRVLIEKPFGADLDSARELNNLLLGYFNEEQIYRIDHYQGKETVQNLMVVRFANSIFEPLWNKDYIDHIEISVLEQDDAKARLAYYDRTGAIKDMVQNHILQMLSLITMNEPKELTADYIRDEKLKILQNLVPFDAEAAKNNLVRGQYDSYHDQIGVQSNTETYVALKVFINTPRWQGVPIYLRTGKALKEKVAEVSVHFKENDRCLFKGCASNVLTFRIQPDESVHLRVNNKIPGFGILLHQGDYEFGYHKAFMTEIPGAYERLLLDFMEGDQRLFIRSDEIEAAWSFIDSLSRFCNQSPLEMYGSGSQGPKEADEMMERDIKEWWTK